MIPIWQSERRAYLLWLYAWAGLCRSLRAWGNMGPPVRLVLSTYETLECARRAREHD